MNNQSKTEDVKRNYEYLGDFHLSGTQLRVSDPSYEKDTWCSGVVENCQPGTWEGRGAGIDKRGSVCYNACNSGFRR